MDSFPSKTMYAAANDDKGSKKPLSSPFKAISYLLLTLVFSLCLAITVLPSGSTTLSSFISISKVSSVYMSLPGQGWHARAQAHPDGSTYEPARSDLIFVLQRKTKVEPEGFTLALFAPDIAVDAMGKVLKLSSEDWNALEALAGRAKDKQRVPETGSFGNQWRIQQRRTDLPIDQFHFAQGASDPLYVVGVYGYDGETRTLSKPVGEITELPEVNRHFDHHEHELSLTHFLKDLHAVLKLTLEGRENYDRDTKEKVMISKVLTFLN
ncbi:hypothetical protein EW146_g366 [Bondarzewia mesenterica]|uniref:Uncharacterized protein n=1 Tax=Bondarzewia mesenterica TaxID=1095465 RepID=A0A4V6S1L5_9AGAM|nr:hypothetical protein EW146_g366 [Bondarzewia mesenterica]